MFASLHLPNFSLQALRRAQPDLAGRPLAVLDGDGRKAHVLQACRSARAAGVVAGMTATQALARCGQAVIRSRSPEAEASSARDLLACAFAFSPRVEQTADGLCTVDLAGAPLTDLEKRGRQASARLAAVELDLRIGFASTPLLAFYAATRADPALAPADERSFLSGLPLAMADPSPQAAEVLAHWGIRSLGQLSDLPRDAVGRRLGPEGLSLWDRAAGRETRLLRLLAEPETFEESCELENPVETLEPLLFLLQRFLDRLCLRLQAASLSAGALDLKVSLADGLPHERSFRLPEPTARADLLFRVLHAHLENVRADSPAVGLLLRLQPVRPIERQAGLFDAAARDPRRFAETLDALAGLVGSARAGSPRHEDSWRPDAFRLEAMADTVAPPEPAPVLPGLGLPLRRWRPALPASVELQGERPAYLSTSSIRGRIRAALGPWSGSGHWWEPAAAWSREEWDIELEAGGLYRLIRQPSNLWSLEGEYG
jgi:protein ImuB